MLIKITIEGKTKKFTSILEAIAFLSTYETQGFSKKDYEEMIESLRDPHWITIK